MKKQHNAKRIVGVIVMGLIASAIPVSAQTVLTNYASAGAYTYTVPAGVTEDHGQGPKSLSHTLILPQPPNPERRSCLWTGDE